MNKLQTLNTKRFKKAYAAGGTPNPNDPNQTQGLSSAIGAAGTIVGSVADAMDTGNSHGRQRGITVGLHQGATLAAAGATLGGPIGAAVGGGIGLAEGLISSIGAKKAEAAEDRNQNYEDQLSSQQAGNARIAADPNLKYGNASAQNFAGGGQLPKDPIVVNNPNSRKLQMYQDSLALYKAPYQLAKAAKANMMSIYQPKVTQQEDNAYAALTKWNGMAPKKVGSISAGNDELFTYKKPTQPVVYQKPIPVGPPSVPQVYGADGKNAPSATNPLMTVHKDGSYRQWGEATPPPVPILPPTGGPSPLKPSDKANGTSSTYYRSDGTRNTPTPDEIQSPGGYKAKGGSIHIKPSHEGRFTAYKKRTGKTTEEALHSKDPHVRKMANFAKNAAGWKKAFGGSMGQPDIPQAQQVPGGSLSPMNSQAVQVNGDSHAQGGVQLPSAEVEGGETIANGFVFSKEMGFADLHKPIAKAIGKIEAKPIDPVRRKTMSILKGRELGLAMAQESIKHKMGMPSDLTGGQ